MEDVLNKIKKIIKKFLDEIKSDLPGHAGWIFLLVLSLWNFSECERYLKDAPTVMQEIAALQFSVKASILLCGAVVVYYLHGIRKELKTKNEEKDKKTKK